jgi:trk system potassium uptake protein TrkA
VKVLIVGAGEVGFHIANRIATENKDVVVIDKNPEAIRRISDNLDVQVMVGSGSSPVVLEEAGIRDAHVMLAVTNSDEINLVACLVTNMISPSTKKLVRLRAADFDDYHDAFKTSLPHIDTVINPEIEVVKTIDLLMSFPGAVDVGEFAQGRVYFIGVTLDQNSGLGGIKLSELSTHIGKQRLLIAALIRGEKLIIPHGNDRLMPDDLVYFITKKDKVYESLKIFGKHETPVQRAMIIGGGRVGYRLAVMLEQKNIYTKIIEKKMERCRLLAERLNKTVVLQGDGSDQDLLAEENIHDMDAVITLTNDEETNILASLLAKQMGARKTITRISKFSYFPLMNMIGIQQVVSPRLSAINTILQHIRRGKVLSAKSIKGEQAEVMEALALETSDIVGKPLKNISFPKGTLVTGIIRGDNITIPSGESVIEPGDRIIIFAQRSAIPKVEKILMVKLEYF